MARQTFFTKINSESATLIALFLITATVAGAAAFVSRKPAETGAVAAPQKIAVSGATLLKQCRTFRKKAKSEYTLVVFTDYECPACRQVDGGIESLVQKKGDRLNYAVLNFPLPYHKQAKPLAILAEAKGLRGDSWREHTRTMRDDIPSPADLKRDILALPPADQQKATDAVDADMRLAKSLNITQTPTFYLCSKRGDTYKISTLKQLDMVMEKGL